MGEVARSWPVSDSRRLNALLPDFANQRNRLMVPCVGSSEYVWVRARSVISLGELFVHLHRRYTVRDIYYMYLHLEIVSLKRVKPAPKGKRGQLT